jgi:tetratricopeptide (TPR) repeat protein
MYLLMLDQHPLEVSTYSHAIVSNIMAGDTISMGNLLEQSMQNNVPFDSLLNSVQHVSLQLGSSDLYERVLLTSRQRFSWLSRGINAYLLKYYDFRNNAPEIIRYAKIMLAGMPDDITFQRQLARGYMLNNQPEYAVEVWFNIIEKNPEHYDTLIDIASYFEDTGEHSRAITYWQRAYKIRQTPYVKAMLN